MKRFITFCLALTVAIPMIVGCDNSPAARKADAEKKATDAEAEAAKANVDVNANAEKDRIDAQKKAEEAGSK